jgi:CheY-like chemotaxis protein
MLLDFQMPLMNGIDVYNQVKAMFQEFRNKHKHLEIIDPVFVFLTAFATTNFQKHLKSLGVEYIYEKPVSKEVL